MKSRNQFLKFILISVLWSLTFPIIKYIRLNGAIVWPVSFYQCVFSAIFIAFNKHHDIYFKNLKRIDFKTLVTLGLLRNFLGISILNYLLLSQSVTNVTIALLFIPFVSLVIECSIYHFRATKSQYIGIFISAISVTMLMYEFNYINKIAWHFFPLTILVSVLFGIEAIILTQSKIKSEVIIFWQNVVGAICIFLIISIINIKHANYAMLSLPKNMIYFVCLVSLLSIAANKLFINLTKQTGASISTQINIMIVLLGCIYDMTLYKSSFFWYNVILVILAIFSTILITKDHSTKQSNQASSPKLFF